MDVFWIIVEIEDELYGYEGFFFSFLLYCVKGMSLNMVLFLFGGF